MHVYVHVSLSIIYLFNLMAKTVLEFLDLRFVYFNSFIKFLNHYHFKYFFCLILSFPSGILPFHGFTRIRMLCSRFFQLLIFYMCLFG